MNEIELKDNPTKKIKFKALSFAFIKSDELRYVISDFIYLKPWLASEKAGFIRTFILFSLSTILIIAIPKIISFIIDNGISGSTLPLQNALLLFFIASLLKIFFDIAYKWSLINTGQKITKKMRLDMFNALEECSIKFFDKNSSGRILSRSVSDLNNLSTFFTTNIFTLFSDILIILGSLIMIFSLSWQIALMVCLSLIILFIFMMNVTQEMFDWSKQYRLVISRISSQMSDTMNNLTYFHTSNFDQTWRRRTLRLHHLLEQRMKRAIMAWGSFSSTHVLLMGLTLALTLWIAFQLLYQEKITYGNFVALITYTLMCFQPFLDISEKLNAFLTAIGSVFRMKDILPHPKESTLWHEDSDKKINWKEDLKISNLNFAYQDNHYILKNINVEIKQGDLVGIVGRTGSGKSTFLQLLMNFYSPPKGSIFIGEVDIVDISPKERARKIGFVSQELFIFKDTLRENIRLYDESISDEAILNILETLNLKDHLEKHQVTLDSIIEQENLLFSQGEKQLLTIARVLLRSPELLLFDEATAYIDSSTERGMIKKISSLLEHKTVIFIAHRFESLSICNKIIVFENGSVKKIITKNKGEMISENECE